MKIRCTYDKLVPLSELKPHPKNRNDHPDDQIARLSQILEYQGWRYPVKVSLLSGYVTSGHGRIEAAKKNGWTEVPVNFQEYESEEQEYADLIADNSIASWSELDLSAINTDIGDLGPDFDIDLLGLKDFLIEPAEKFLEKSLDNHWDEDFDKPIEDMEIKILYRRDDQRKEILDIINCHKFTKFKNGKSIVLRWDDRNG